MKKILTTLFLLYAVQGFAFNIPLGDTAYVDTDSLIYIIDFNKSPQDTLLIIKHPGTITDNHILTYDSATNTASWEVAPGAGSGENNTASNLGGGLANFDSKSSVDLRFNSFLATDFNLAANQISLDRGLAATWTAVHSFVDNNFQINNPANSFQYIFGTAALAADRTVELPLLTGGDTFTFNAFAATLTNKTINSDNNTITNIVNADVKAAAGIVYSKLTFSNNIVALDLAAESVGESELAESMNFTSTGTWSFRDNLFQLQNPANTFQYILGTNAIVADRTVDLPLLTGNDIFTFNSFVNLWGDGIKQTFNPSSTNAGLNAGSLAGQPSSPADGDIIYNTTANQMQGRVNGAWVDLGAGAGGGETNTASNLGGGLANFDTKSGVDLRFNSFAAADFDLGTNVLTIDRGLAPAWTGAHTWARAGLAGDFQNSTDAASNEVIRFGGGNRGTPTDNDEGRIGFFLDDDLGAQTEFVRFGWVALDVTNTSKDSRPEFNYYTANTLRQLSFPAITADDVVSTLGFVQTFTAIKTISADWVNTANPWADNEVSNTLTSSLFVGSGSTTNAIDLATAEVAGTLAGTAVDQSSVTVRGTSEIATVAETNTGTDPARAVSPDGLDGWTGSVQVTTLGTIATGTWEGTTVAVNQGGTGATALDDILGTTDEISVAGGANTIIGGNVTLTLPDVYEEVMIPAGYFNPKAGNLTGATALADDADNTNDFTLDQLEFSGTAENFASAVLRMPPDWDGTTAPTFRVQYYTETSHASNTVDWEISTGYIRPGTDTWIAALGTGVATAHNPTTLDIWYETALLSPTPSGTAAAGAFIKIRLKRDGDDGTNDTHNVPARLVYLIMAYLKTTYGDETAF